MKQRQGGGPNLSGCRCEARWPRRSRTGRAMGRVWRSSGPRWPGRSETVSESPPAPPGWGRARA
eukprot:15744952-Heterocapsa_arctica.AAC.1